MLAALLLARGRHVSVDALIEGLWGERPPRTASGTVRTLCVPAAPLPGSGHEPGGPAGD